MDQLQYKSHNCLLENYLGTSKHKYSERHESTKSLLRKRWVKIVEFQCFMLRFYSKCSIYFGVSTKLAYYCIDESN